MIIGGQAVPRYPRHKTSSELYQSWALGGIALKPSLALVSYKFNYWNNT